MKEEQNNRAVVKSDRELDATPPTRSQRRAIAKKEREREREEMYLPSKKDQLLPEVNILGKKDRINYNSIPSVIYTNPEVASVGETTESIKEKGIDASVETVTLKYSGRYIAENEHGNGVVKIITDNKHHNIIGVHMIGSYAPNSRMVLEMAMRSAL